MENLPAEMLKRHCETVFKVRTGSRFMSGLKKDIFADVRREDRVGFGISWYKK